MLLRLIRSNPVPHNIRLGRMSEKILSADTPDLRAVGSLNVIGPDFNPGLKNEMKPECCRHGPFISGSACAWPAIAFEMILSGVRLLPILQLIYDTTNKANGQIQLTENKKASLLRRPCLRLG